jgi:hypothetical protein
LGCPTSRPQPASTTRESFEGPVIRFPSSPAAFVSASLLDRIYGPEEETRCCCEGDREDVHVQPEPDRQDRRGLLGEEPHGRGRPSPWPGNCTTAAGQRSRHLPRPAVRGASFSLHPAVVDILRYFDIYLHQLTPNAILRLSVYMWICQTTKIKPSAEGFASAHQVHHQRWTVFEEEGDQSVEKDCQFGCLNFLYKSGVVSPVTAYRNKWPSDWQQHWFYYAVSPLLPEGLTPGYEGAASPSRVLWEEPFVPRKR